MLESLEGRTLFTVSFADTSTIAYYGGPPSHMEIFASTPKSGSLDTDDKLGNFEIQDLMSQFNQAETLASSIQKKLDDTRNAMNEGGGRRGGGGGSVAMKDLATLVVFDDGPSDMIAFRAVTPPAGPQPDAAPPAGNEEPPPAGEDAEPEAEPVAEDAGEEVVEAEAIDDGGAMPADEEAEAEPVAEDVDGGGAEGEPEAPPADADLVEALWGDDALEQAA
jgi:hypothetical protein